MTTLDAQASLTTAIQHACKTAKESRKAVDLEFARQLMDIKEFRALPKKVQEDLSWAYAGAVMAVTGGGLGG